MRDGWKTLRNEALGIFETKELLRYWEDCMARRVPADEAIRLYAWQHDCSRVLVIEVLQANGIELPSRYDDLYPPIRKAPEPEQEREPVFRERWQEVYGTYLTSQEKCSYIRIMAHEQKRSPLDVADDLKKAGFRVPQLYDRERRNRLVQEWTQKHYVYFPGGSRKK